MEIIPVENSVSPKILSNKCEGQMMLSSWMQGDKIFISHFLSIQKKQVNVVHENKGVNQGREIQGIQKRLQKHTIQHKDQIASSQFVSDKNPKVTTNPQKIN